jgi:AraC-like DNA-binding protein
MQADKSHGAMLRFSTRDLPERDRFPFWREVLGRQIVHAEFEPQPDVPFEAGTSFLSLPGLRLMGPGFISPARMMRSGGLLADGDEDVALVANLSGNLKQAQRRREVYLDSGDGVAVLQAEPSSMDFSQLKFTAVVVPRTQLTPFVRDLEDQAGRLIPGGTEALRLLRGYVTMLFENPDIADPSLCKLVATHVQDLVALAMGATRDGKEIALARGVRAARLQAIKTDFAANPSLTLSSLASRQNVTPRYVQQLFETDGTTFTAYALDQRLTRAWRMLASGRHAHLTIGMIALEAGFGDVSHFNRSFRRRYGATPSEVRAEAAACSTAEVV